MGVSTFLVLLAVLAGAGALVPRFPHIVRQASGLLALVFLALALAFSTTTYVSSDQVGIVSKNALGANLSGGKIIAVNGEKGIQADVLAPGWHSWIWPFIYSVKTVPLVEIKSDEVGLIETTDGTPLDPGQLFAEEWPTADVQQMLDARYFLTTGQGRKGRQAAVLTPGKYRINTDLYHIKMVKQTEVPTGEVAVLKANYGRPPTKSSRPGGQPAADGDVVLADAGEMGVRAEVLMPGKYALNTDAFTVTQMWTTNMIAHYTAAGSGNPVSNAQNGNPTHEPTLEERAITVRTNDGFTFPVDVRVMYLLEPRNTPIVAAKLGDDEGITFRNALNSAVRAIFRDNAEKVRALDYVSQRSDQEQKSLKMLSEQMARFGITIQAVQIGDVGDEKTLGLLLKTQTDREIATQEQVTFQEQQKAAEKKKELARVTQESEEEKKLATAAYAAKIAEQKGKEQITEAGAEAQAMKVRAVAQAEAYREIATQIGKSNAALIEVLKIVGERNIQITPRVMIGGSAAANSGNSALVGTMLDAMLSKEEDSKPASPPAK